MFWQVVLPQPAPSARWAPGAATRLALGNAALLCLVAGLTKLESPMWRDGSAPWAVLLKPIAWWPHLMLDAPSWWLRALSWGALAVEPLLALLVTTMLRGGSSASGRAWRSCCIGARGCEMSRRWRARTKRGVAAKT